MTVHGASMGLVAFTGSVREGETGCEATEWESETSVRCLVWSGRGGTRRVVMTAGERGGSVSGAWSVDVGGVSMGRRGNRAGTGSASVTVHGASMGLVAFTGSVREGETGCEATEWESETTVRCLEGHGVGGTQRVVMTAEERSGSLSEGYSVDGGSVSMRRGGNTAGAGSGMVTVHGSGMGLMGMTGMMRSGETGCEGTEWESETSVRCLEGHGVGGTQQIGRASCRERV